MDMLHTIIQLVNEWGGAAQSGLAALPVDFVGWLAQVLQSGISALPVDKIDEMQQVAGITLNGID
jgi:hypothetical protein